MQRASSHQAMLAIFTSKKSDHLERNIDNKNLLTDRQNKVISLKSYTNDI